MSDFIDYNDAVYPPDVSPVRVSGRSSIRAKDEETFEVLKAPDSSEPMKIRVENNRPLHITYVPPERKILQDLIADIRHHVRHSEGEDHEYIAQAFRKGMTLFADRAEQRLKEVQGE